MRRLLKLLDVLPPSLATLYDLPNAMRGKEGMGSKRPLTVEMTGIKQIVFRESTIDAIMRFHT